MPDQTYKKFIEPLSILVKQAGTAILAIYHQSNSIAVCLKSDSSPITQADKIAHDIINTGLRELTPEWPVLSEEAAAIPFAERMQWEYYWLVDPLDGTKEFINRTDEFTINIGLIHHHKPVLGIVYLPVFDLLYFAAEPMLAYKQSANSPPQRIQARTDTSKTPQIVISRRHNDPRLERFLEAVKTYELVSAGSSLKICLVAEGKADLYPRLSPTSEWDTAAGQYILEQAGGRLTDLTGTSLSYNNRESLINPLFLATSNNNYNWLQYLNEYI